MAAFDRHCGTLARRTLLDGERSGTGTSKVPSGCVSLPPLMGRHDIINRKNDPSEDFFFLQLTVNVAKEFARSRVCD